MWFRKPSDSSAEIKAPGPEERARALRVEYDALIGGTSTREPSALQDEMQLFFEEVLPELESLPIATLALVDVSMLSIQLACAAKNWHYVHRSGVVLATTILSIRRNGQDLDDRLEREIGRFTSRHLCEFVYALCRLGLASDVGVYCDLLLQGGFAGRQFLQTSSPETREAWDWATGVIANGGAMLSDEELSAKFAHGAWMTARQRTDIDPTLATDQILNWVRGAQEMFSSAPQLPLHHHEESTDAVWKEMVERLDRSVDVPPGMQLLFASLAGVLSPLSAQRADRDLVYLVSGMAGGAAVRFFGGACHRRPPEIVLLPSAGLQFILDVADSMDESSALAASDLETRTKRFDECRRDIGEYLFRPLMKEWSDLRKVTFVALGDLQRIPVSSSLVDGRRLNEILEVTIAPNAATFYVAAEQQPDAAHERSVAVIADPSQGRSEIPWARHEAHRVAAVYGREPDLVVNYGTAPSNLASSRRSFEGEIPALNTTSEHVLTLIEDASVVHLACHGYVPKAEGLPGLLLHGRLTIDALEHHRFADGAIVVLSACSVGQSIADAPFAQLGFPSMVLSSGAREVVAAGQPLIDCSETMEFMAMLHEHLRRGASATSALSRAMKEAEDRGVPSAIWGSLETHGVPTPEYRGATASRREVPAT